jgi:hypothetical protein
VSIGETRHEQAINGANNRLCNFQQSLLFGSKGGKIV